MATFRAPGTKLIGDSKQAGIERFPIETTETRLDQVFSMTGDPAATVDAYRRRGRGRRLVRSSSRVAPGRSRPPAVRSAGPSRADRQPCASERSWGRAPESSRRKDTLTVSIMAGGDSTVVNVGLRRKDLGCLTGLDPSSPEMVAPKTDRITPEALCAAVNVDGIPVVDQNPYGNPDDGNPSTCLFYGGGAGLLFEVGEAGQPMARYLDKLGGGRARPPALRLRWRRERRHLGHELARPAGGHESPLHVGPVRSQSRAPRAHCRRPGRAVNLYAPAKKRGPWAWIGLRNRGRCRPRDLRPVGTSLRGQAHPRSLSPPAEVRGRPGGDVQGAGHQAPRRLEAGRRRAVAHGADGDEDRPGLLDEPRPGRHGGGLQPGGGSRRLAPGLRGVLPGRAGHRPGVQPGRRRAVKLLQHPGRSSAPAPSRPATSPP